MHGIGYVFCCVTLFPFLLSIPSIYVGEPYRYTGNYQQKKRAILALAFRSGCVPASLVYNKQKDVDFGAPAVQITQSALP